MFSYWAGVWQTYRAKRGEFRFNGAALSLSGAPQHRLLRGRGTSFLDSLRSLSRNSFRNSLYWNELEVEGSGLFL